MCTYGKHFPKTEVSKEKQNIGLFFMLILGKSKTLDFMQTELFELRSHSTGAERHPDGNQPSRAGLDCQESNHKSGMKSILGQWMAGPTMLTNIASRTLARSQGDGTL